MSDPEKNSSNLFFPVVVGAGGLFIATVLAFMALTFSETHSPLAHLFEEYAGMIFLGEVAVTITVGLCALFVDRRQTLRSQHRLQDEGEHDPDETNRHETSLCQTEKQRQDKKHEG